MGRALWGSCLGVVVRERLAFPTSLCACHQSSRMIWYAGNRIYRVMYSRDIYNVHIYDIYICIMYTNSL